MSPIKFETSALFRGPWRGEKICRRHPMYSQHDRDVLFVVYYPEIINDYQWLRYLRHIDDEMYRFLKVVEMSSRQQNGPPIATPPESIYRVRLDVRCSWLLVFSCLQLTVSASENISLGRPVGPTAVVVRPRRLFNVVHLDFGTYAQPSIGVLHSVPGATGRNNARRRIWNLVAAYK